MSDKVKKHEAKYSTRQQLTNKFTQKLGDRFFGLRYEVKDEDAVRKLVDKMCN